VATTGYGGFPLIPQVLELYGAHLVDRLRQVSHDVEPVGHIHGLVAGSATTRRQGFHVPRHTNSGRLVHWPVVPRVPKNRVSFFSVHSRPGNLTPLGVG
jgi:hypothetical protein